MDYNELITDIEKTPVDSEGVANNIARLLRHAKYLESRKDTNLSGSREHDAPRDVKAFHLEMQKLWKGIEKFGVNRDELRRPNTVKHYAEGANLMHEYNLFWHIHSKYVHPSSYLLFGRNTVVYGDDPRRFFLATAQYYAARNVRDLYKMIEAASDSE